MTKQLTSEGFKKIKEELDYLKTTKRKEIAEKLKDAASFGDLKENAAYEEAKDSQGFLEGRIRELEDILKQSKIIEKKQNGRVEIGSTILVALNGDQEQYQIVEPEESDIGEKKVSCQSPFGEAFLGKRKGEKVKVETMDGKINYTIIQID